MRIELTDNNLGQKEGITYNRKDISVLFPFSDKKIAKLCGENKRLLIFPYSIETSNDKIGNTTLFTIENTDEAEQVRIRTGNLMGFIGIGGHQIKIKSRFDKKDSDYFLHYMLQKVLSFNLFDLNYNKEEDDIFDFTMFMFPYLLKNAMRQGIYREYRNFKHNDANVKGVIDIGRHLKYNTPFIGKLSYNTREYVYDNNMTELIRHTIEFMKSKRYGNAVLNLDKETIDNVKSIIEYTPLYNKNERSDIINKNLRQKNHPYYTEYQTLQSLCLQILKTEEIKYGDNEDELTGILFDGAWLWEEYVNTILKEEGYLHPQNKHKKGHIYLFEGGKGRCYPDFYKAEEGIVLDAKYKQLDSYDYVYKIGRDDLYQLITYLTIQQASKGGFIAPLNESQTSIPTAVISNTRSIISIFGIEISKTATSYKAFCHSMKEAEMRFIKSINDCFS